MKQNNYELIGALSGDLTLVRFVLSVVCWVLALGFFFASVDNANYQQLNNLAAKSVWGGIFFCQGTLMFLTTCNNFPFYFKRLISLCGVWLWTYIFLSFTIFDSTPIASTEWLISVPIMLEIWLLSEREIK